ncbi:TlpA disulfide reductase family protein [Psychromonas antarctica]|uniref:TlpA disulfide reductase family protein n=1 Tax=Psychromonas antarctica TaxID=67573 RepID=UPI001EE8D70F|nr:TlpA disulfide reductase family protein [Psychromonas antarctica]MCG6200861.1 TlpA family protein disulfide reductase [Psychromonas antarctica]
MKKIIPLLSLFVVLISSFQVTAQEQWLDKIELSEYQNKVLYLDFWASWCAPCRKSFPWLNKMHAKYKDKGLVIIGINVDQDIQTARRFLNNVPADFHLYSDSQGVLAQKYEVAAMPSAYLFSVDGKLTDRHLGFKKSQQTVYEASIVKLLAQLPRNQQSKGSVHE